MPFRSAAIAALLFCSVGAIPQIGGAAESPTKRATVALAPFTAAGQTDTADTLTTLVEADLAGRGFPLVDRQRFNDAVQEQGLALAGITDTTALTSAGQLAGAQLLVSGRLIEVRGERLFALRLTRVDTAEVLPATVPLKAGASLADTAAAVGAKIAEIAPPPPAGAAAALAESTDKMAAAIAELRERAKGRTLPTIEVSIPETHISRRVPDPAAETEIVRLLRAVGFPIVARPAKDPAAVRVEGEAFSEFAMQAGALVSCRGRVEIKVIDVAEGEVIYVDDAHASGVDVAEAIAGKSALRQAGQTLAPKLATALIERAR